VRRVLCAVSADCDGGRADYYFQEEDEGHQRESRAAILKAKFGEFLATLYVETLASMKRVYQTQELVHFNASKFLSLCPAMSP
jgi:hypothetical protein